ncbi:DoxX family protein [Streptomyces sp. NPDC057702]|uniref:DoxX family protein n=1 Tax=unclassified Streptomyces TaxID=2593676 RepID=UPI0036C9F4C1
MAQGRWTTGGATGGPAGARRRGWRSALAPYALLPLRVFLGVTFVYASLDKLTDATFLSASGPGSIGDTMRFARSSAAFPDLVDLALKAPTGFGYAIAVGELAVGLGTLFGVLARLAALGGALISLSLWLTVSWSTEPYYYGNDLIYLMAWLPLVLAGAPYLSVDAALAGSHWRRGRRRWRRGRRVFG